MDSDSGRLKCPFATLGLSKAATTEDVRRRYKELAKVHHPDAGGDEATFRSIHDAYEECLERVDSGHTADPDPDPDPGADRDTHRRGGTGDGARGGGSSAAERRERARAGFGEARDAGEVDALLAECLRRGYFAVGDVGEPLRLALGRYHAVGGLGLAHLAHCTAAMAAWEEATRRIAPCEYYHMVLVVYTNEAYLGHIDDASVITEVVTKIIERMEDRGLPVDDWTMTLANRTFRALPFPDW